MESEWNMDVLKYIKASSYKNYKRTLLQKIQLNVTAKTITRDVV
jgi:hypothetical protein